MFVVFDLDGTLALIEHRRHFIQGGRRNWPAFFRACSDDEPNRPIVAMFQELSAAGHRVEIWSGRSDEVRAETDEWLAQHVGEGVTANRMRPEKDYQPDVALKESWLREEAFPPDLVFDDRQGVVDMWRRNGIVCAQVAPGDF
ncbi:phosphatase domain-containing protein [Parvularcula maris]|uniref:Polynucleotide kinase PNKP phosphatase domain-containing protein n=1 Tax=Parvularcula maris TaxID=2965077 RepID=A0A9X2RJ14_9PROT|nr:hypothetical protein [Parvularcula maris]MCQ8184188.1 hypothetical protein [Parvularcula maris]